MAGNMSKYDIGGTQPSTYSSVPMQETPKAAMPAMPVNSLAGASGNEDYWSPTNAAPGDVYDSSLNKNNWGKIYQAPDGAMKANEKGEKPPNEEVDYDWNKLIGTYESMAEGVSRQGQYTPGYDGPPITQDTDTWRNGSPGSKSGSSGGSYGGTIYQGPVYDYPEYNRPEPFEFGATLDLPDYDPPEYDEAKEKAVREEFIQTNKGSMSKLAQQAILGSANVNNPQARGQIIKAALEGFGESLGQTTLKGSEAGRRAAEKQQATETGIYQAKFQIESKEKMAKYDADMKADVMNWELDVRQADKEYSNQLSQWNSMPNDIKAKNAPGTNPLSMGGQGAMRI